MRQSTHSTAQFSCESASIMLVIGLLVSGLVSTYAGLAGYYLPILSLVLLPVITLWGVLLLLLIKKWFSLEIVSKLLGISIVIVWLSHLAQVFVPETGYDAVWYHLPVISAFTSLHKVVYLSDFYQSAYPLFSDLIFGLGFMIRGELGAKLIAYLFGLSLILVCFQLGQLIFKQTRWSLLAVLVISTIQVVSWQSASFYVDVAKAFWEIAAWWLLLRAVKPKNEIDHKSLAISALCLGASLATKQFSILLLPIYLWGVWQITKQKKQALWYLLLSLLVPLPFYWFSWQALGNPLAASSIVMSDLSVISGQKDLYKYIQDRTLGLLLSPLVLTFSRDYVSVLCLVLLPMVVIKFKNIWHKTELRVLLLFILLQWLLWWYIPPLSTRYALSGFVVMILLWLFVTQQAMRKYQIWRLPILLTLILALMINITPRALVNLRSWKYLSGQQSKTQYISQFYDGWIDDLLIRWHQL